MSSYPHQPTQVVSAAQSWIIGSAHDCDEVVAQPTVSGYHCRLTRQGNQYWIEDLKSRNKTYVNGVPIPVGQIVPIHLDTRVTLGQHVPMPWPAEALKPQIFQPDNPPIHNAGNQPVGRIITIGRAPDSVKRIDLPTISSKHARIVFENGVPILEDLNSRNGTSIDRVDNRIRRAPLDPNSDVYLGSYKIAASELLGKQKVEIGENAFHKVSFKERSNTMVIGRDPQSDLPLDFPMVSWRHARLTREGNKIYVEDLNSRNGTFVDGLRITTKVLVKPRQQIGLGSYRFQLLESGELAQREYHGNVTIQADEVVVNAREGKRLIEPVSMTIFPSELVALMGPAGSGKTTLLKALNGYTRPAKGSVLFNGDSLYDYYDRFRQQLGYVPQDDIVHAQLKVKEALYFSARLRTDLSDEEIEVRSEKVLRQLKMWEKRDEIIGSPERKVLSGGQRKRVNIALELINDTPVLFLDEPTSGLSSYDAESVIELLKELSTQGKTIITTIHQPSLKIYKMFDDLIMINRAPEESHGTMVYFGPAYPDSIQFLNHLPLGAAPTDDLSPEMLLSGVAKQTSPEWLKEYKDSRYYQDFVVERPEERPKPEPATSAPGAQPKRHFDLTQWFALVKRNYLVKSRDKTQTIILLSQAPLFAFLIALVYHPLTAASYSELTPKLIGAHFLMVVAALWFGCNNAARDIVGEWTVYKRERMVTLKLGSYVFSKLALLFVLGIFQCLCLLGIVHLTLHLKSNFGLDLLVLVTSAMVGTGLGLAISAFSKTTESAIALLPIVLLPIIALGGGMRPVYQIGGGQHRLFTTIITDLIPSRWAFEANLLNETVKEDGWTKTDGKEPVEPLGDSPNDEEQKQAMQPHDPELAQDPKKFAKFAQTRCEDAALASGKSSDGVVTTLEKEQGKKVPRVLCGDVAEMSIPHYLITWTDKDENGEDRDNIARAYRGEAKGEAGKILNDDELKNDKAAAVYKAVNFRHSFRTSMLVLLGMLGALIIGVLSILYMRDKEQQ